MKVTDNPQKIYVYSFFYPGTQYPAPMKKVLTKRLNLREIEQYLKVHKIEIFFGFDFEICIISLLVMWKY